jgi:DNA-binding MltR family transcriptional regulator
LAPNLVARRRTASVDSQAVQFFEGYGPLGTFSARIDIAYFFKLIDPTTYNDLRAIKNIRNTFAHSKTVLTFQSREIIQKGDALTGSRQQNGLGNLYYDRAQFCLDAIRATMERQIFDSAFEK